MLTSTSTLSDVAFAVCTVLAQIDTIAVLTGGSAATYYAPDAYQSLDADFVLNFDADGKRVLDALGHAGFTRSPSGMFHHDAVAYTVEFPPGPLMIGRDLITDWSTVQRGQETLHVLSVTDCVRDRFIKFWAWNDRAGFLAWTARERREEPLYEQRRVDEFLAALGPPRGTSR